MSSANATEAAEAEQGRAASELVLRPRVAEDEAMHVLAGQQRDGNLQRVVVKQTRKCVEKARKEMDRVTKAEARCVAALARASNGLGRVTKFESAKVNGVNVYVCVHLFFNSFVFLLVLLCLS